MSEVPGSPEGPLRRVAAKVGFVGSALAVFACGWLGMRSDDWRTIVLFSALAVVAAALASAFSRTGR